VEDSFLLLRSTLYNHSALATAVQLRATVPLVGNALRIDLVGLIAKMDDPSKIVVDFCREVGFALSGVCVVTVQQNRGSLYGSFVIDMRGPTPVLKQSYPKELPSSQHKYTSNFSVSVVTDLDPSVIDRASEEADETVASSDLWCCDPSNWTKKSTKRTSRDTIFEDFRHSRNSHPNIVFKVRKQINYGPDVWTKHFTLNDGKITETESATHKIHAFKNYVCHAHNMYYEVDLFSRTGSVRNAHHMRALASTQYGPEILRMMADSIEVKK